MTGAPDRGRDGFTLLELLIAMTLLGLVFALLTGALGFGAAAWRTGGERLERNTSLQAVHDLLRRRIGGALALRGPPFAERDFAAFRGDAETVEFAGAAPARAMPDGIFAYRLAVEDGTLVLRWAPMGWVDDAPSPPADLTPEILVQGLEALEISYFGTAEREEAAGWRAGWQAEDGLPELVKLSFRFPPEDARRWPDFVIAVRTH